MKMGIEGNLGKGLTGNLCYLEFIKMKKIELIKCKYCDDGFLYPELVLHERYCKENPMNQ